MFAVLDNVIRDIALGPQTRKVKKYLEEATNNSVLEDLGKVLSSQLRGWRENERLQATFDKYCVEGSSQRKYWKEESFRQYVRSAHSEAALSDPEIQLLWRSFHYYAYHPFPHNLTEGELNFGAFKRAVLLTLVRCDDLLGTRELEYFWRNDASYFRKARFARLFRSIGTPRTTTQPMEQSVQIDSSLSDAMDILVMVVPQFIHGGPSPDQLEVVARKLFTKGPAVTPRVVGRKEVSTLIGLLLRLRVKKETWGSGGSYFGVGDIAESCSSDAELTEELVNSLAEHKSEQPITSEQLLKAVELMPNLQLRFYQLWAVLFQPLVAPANKTPSQASEVPSTNAIGAVLLFAPQLKTENYPLLPARQDERIAVENAQFDSDSQDFSIIRLVQTLSRPSSGYIVLLTGVAVATATASTAVVGAYFPNPLRITSSKEEEEKGQVGTKNPHLLFQLQPEFRLLRWTKPGVSIKDLIKAEVDTLSLAEIATREDSETLNLPYRIGKSNGQGGGLNIDLGKKTATLESCDGQWYKDLVGEVYQLLSKNWEVNIDNSRMDIFTIMGAQDLQNRSVARVEDFSKRKEAPEVEIAKVEAPEDTAPRVQGEALKKRIQGFGSR